MQKIIKNFAKIVLLVAVVLSDLMTPIRVLANELREEVNKGDLRLNGETSSTGSVTTSLGSSTNEGDVLVTKTVSKTDTEGRYKIEFNIKGKDVTSSTEVTKPVYAVVVFDRSGSMESTSTGKCLNWFGFFCTEWETDRKWENAVEGTKDFANTLLSKIPASNIALVGFSGDNGWNDSAYDDAEVLRGFANANLDDVNFGTANGGTNLYAGLYEANKLLSASDIPDDAYKYIIVISDGDPTFYYDNDGYTQGDGGSTTEDTYNATISMADTVKTKAEIFSIGYMLSSENVYGDLTAEDILKEVATADSSDDVENGIKHFMNTRIDAIVNSLTDIANQISKKKAGTNAVLTDNIGSAFKIVDTDGTQRSYISEVIPEITEEGTTLSFYVDVDKDSETGWHNTNAGFNLTYTDANGTVQTISSNENPEVYWVQNKYNYIVNYYKDDFNESNLIASDTREAINGTIINEDNVLKDKYVPIGYEFNSLNPENIVVTNDGNTKVINVLYTIKKFNYVVNYYYDNVIDNDLTINESEIKYGTKVDSTNYYLQDSEIREGYILDTANSDNRTYTITDNGVVINIYYKKNSYNYTVNYHFNGTLDETFSRNPAALYGTVINAKDNYLEDINNEGLVDKETIDNTDYFLDPYDVLNNGSITIGTGANILNIYYISTYVNNESIDKTSNIDKVTNTETPITYTVNYKASVNNIKKGDKVTVTIIDTLPYEIDVNASNLNNGIYNSANKTITWIVDTPISEFTKLYNINETITYTVLYKDFASISSSSDNSLINNVIGTTTADGKTTAGVEDSTSTLVEVKSNVTAIYVEENNETNKLIADETMSGLVGADYTTEAKEIFGYTLVEAPENKDGKYTEEDITVKYLYKKNDGEIDNPKIEKTGLNSVDSIDGVFNYKINATGEIKDYVGKVILKVTDTLPYEVNTEKTKLDNNCKYDGDKIITCTKEYTITEADYVTNGNGDKVFKINEEFTLDLVYSGVDSNKVVNNAKSEIILDKIKEETEDTAETEVLSGNVTAIYVEKNNETNKLAADETTTGLSGAVYKTSEKVIYGYTLKEVRGSEEGAYLANQTINVIYLYEKNTGTSTEEFVKEGLSSIDSINSNFDYTLTYNTIINDYVGEVKLTITDILPYEIDEEKSIFSNNCEYVDGKIICTYDGLMVDEDKREINILEKFSLYYAGVDKKLITNKAEAVLTYGETVKNTADEFNSEVKEGKVIVNYVTVVNGQYVKLTDSLELSNLVGMKYTTDRKEFDKYNFVYAIGNKDGEYTEEPTEVTYVYSLTPLPPQTGVEGNSNINIAYIIIAAVLLILRKSSKLLNND